MSDKIQETRTALLAYALSFPSAYEDHPWGETVVKVNKKIFVFLGADPNQPDYFYLTVKLPMSSNVALQYSYISPSGYGLGKSGWVTVKCKAEELPAIELFEVWIEESYRAIAPKKLVAELEK
jgi:predicted DNA-binding protein (MmcQ/YjbR family)